MSTTRRTKMERNLKKIAERESDSESNNQKMSNFKKPSPENNNGVISEEQIDQVDAAKDYQYEFIMRV